MRMTAAPAAMNPVRFIVRPSWKSLSYRLGRMRGLVCLIALKLFLSKYHLAARMRQTGCACRSSYSLSVLPLYVCVVVEVTVAFPSFGREGSMTLKMVLTVLEMLMPVASSISA